MAGGQDLRRLYDLRTVASRDQLLGLDDLGAMTGGLKLVALDELRLHSVPPSRGDVDKYDLDENAQRSYLPCSFTVKRAG
jgi:hypothetical protein